MCHLSILIIYIIEIKNGTDFRGFDTVKFSHKYKLSLTKRKIINKEN